MAHDIIKPSGTTKSTTPHAGGANPQMVPVIGIVKSNIDPLRAGRLSVYITEFGAKNADDPNSWYTVSLMSPFYGRTNGSGPETGHGEYVSNPSSYGMWTSPPDVGSKVVCIFINGDTNLGYYIGCVPDAKALHMVPAIGGTDNIIANAGEAQSYGGATRLPVGNINNSNKDLRDSSSFLSETKPVHSHLAGILNQQGLIRDPIRGVIGSSAQRESPSRVGYGVSTPGRPIFKGGFTDETIFDNLSKQNEEKLEVIARRGGHTLVMDDGDLLGRDQLVRLRTSSGHQILMSDDGQCLFIIHANGQSWVELGKEGTIDMYASNSVNVRTQGDLNLHADNNVNINANKTLNIAAEQINMCSSKETTQRVGTSYSFYSEQKYTVKVAGAMSMHSSGEASYSSNSVTYINGSRVNLNTGSAALVPEKVKPIPVVAHTDTLHDPVKGFVPAPGKLSSIVSRAPAHAPWLPAGAGVDVKVDYSASAAMPTSPSPSIKAASAAAPAVPPTPVTATTASTVPTVAPISKGLDGATTAAIVASVATSAASGIAAEAVKAGAGMVQTATGAALSVGKLAASTQQLVDSNILKPGSEVLINGLSTMQSDVKKLLPPALFTGVPGASNLTEFVKNPAAQITSLTSNLKGASDALVKAGAITSNMAGTAGAVLATAIKGPAAVLGQLSNIPGSIKAEVDSVLGSVSTLISTGDFAGKLASVTGPIGVMASQLGAKISSVADASAAAFSSMLAKLKPFEAGKPINLTALKDAAKAEADKLLPVSIDGVKSLVPKFTGGLTSALSNLPGTLSTGIKNIASNVTGALSNLPGSVSAGITNITSNVTGALGALGAPGGISSGITNIANNVNGALSGALGKVTGAAAGVGALVDKLKSGKVSDVLGDAIDEATASLAAISSSMTSDIKLPISKVGTASRESITSQMAAVFGDARIQVPNYGTRDFSEFTKKMDEQNAALKESGEAYDAKEDAREKSEAAASKYKGLKNDSGDPTSPAVAAAKAEWVTAFADWEKARDKFIKLAADLQRFE